jgi:hypothetical protein
MLRFVSFPGVRTLIWLSVTASASGHSAGPATARLHWPLPGARGRLDSLESRLAYR